ncbi:hypothetical protein GQ43DRAFT_442976 [Delitschia confertaspora ATCC 74209]|uniref:HypA-like protein n=1 Tax=Delitschia confertaspora ATCC 74209 TaxID=1513339 RepID=A0A9P4JGU8_9PLEO|nr:hypothetical protein GQ43DRAFT_442976 [Delitschia confertaspora ATCC 74209]
MATPSKIQLTADQDMGFGLKGISEESARTASQLLQENHERHHIFFNESGFHDHIVHHILTVFALGASPSTLKKQYKNNLSYQKPLKPADQSVVKEMHNPEGFKKYLGQGKRYHEFLVFFKEEMETKGWHNVVNEYLFKGDERADDMLVRLYAGFLHPLIHLGFGIEFTQPAIIAEALAQTAVHENWMGALFTGCEKVAKQNNTTGDKTIVQLLEEIRADKKLSTAPRWEDGNKIREGILGRAAEEMYKYGSEFRVTEERLEERTAEMINAAVLFTASAQHPPHRQKFDFYYMHCVNSSIFFPIFLRQPWLSPSSKIRLLEWKVRADLTLYASRRSPALLVKELSTYPINDEWEDLFARAREFEDDGHSSKLVRAIAHGEKVSREWEEGREGFLVRGDMWLRVGNMAMDSVTVGNDEWVRSCGFEEAWKSVPLRGEGRL